ncbi:hypothetical protein F511_36480 [Dorcoceras hygrometricum]|uniref:Uncharacterized protein n=1 Tax=Dorcoceras hygrometricum TaxID=472368 RepID=A0A2Z7BV38_9LAMI|nr:hypothetical protein F511_36480 [Dorcoceras hygrometricum]
MIGFQIPSLPCTREHNELSQTESSRQYGRNGVRRHAATTATDGDGGSWRRPRVDGRGDERSHTLNLSLAILNTLSTISVRELGNQYLCDPQWFRDTANCVLTTLCITDSACKNQLVKVSVQYGPFISNIPTESTIIGKSRVARDSIAMHTSWRSKRHHSIEYPCTRASGEFSTTKHRLLHASGPHPIPPHDDLNRVGKRVKVRHLSYRVSMTFRVVRTTLYNQDLGLNPLDK